MRHRHAWHRSIGQPPQGFVVRWLKSHGDALGPRLLVSFSHGRLASMTAPTCTAMVHQYRPAGQGCNTPPSSRQQRQIVAEAEVPSVAEITSATLLREAAARLRAEFAFVKGTNPHAGSRGGEAEDKLRSFLNSHLPRRFRACTGFVLDRDGRLSRQMDVLIYDALSAPVYRADETLQIVPSDAVAVAIEVKSRLTKAELVDAAEKLASVKVLSKTPVANLDRAAAGVPVMFTRSFGVVFAYEAETTLETLARNLVEINSTSSSRLWPDRVVVLDAGVIEYTTGLPTGPMGATSPSSCEEGASYTAPMPTFVACRHDPEFALNRFFAALLAHLTFFPYRPASLPIGEILDGAERKTQLVACYHWTRHGELVPGEWEPARGFQLLATLSLRDATGASHGQLDVLPWSGGLTVRYDSPVGLDRILAAVAPGATDVELFPLPNGTGGVWTSILAVDPNDVRYWPERLQAIGLTSTITSYSKNEPTR
jgi:hypothetical protein